MRAGTGADQVIYHLPFLIGHLATFSSFSE